VNCFVSKREKSASDILSTLIIKFFFNWCLKCNLDSLGISIFQCFPLWNRQKQKMPQSHLYLKLCLDRWQPGVYLGICLLLCPTWALLMMAICPLANSKTIFCGLIDILSRIIESQSTATWATLKDFCFHHREINMVGMDFPFVSHWSHSQIF
jgi:hypothetical protein